MKKVPQRRCIGCFESKPKNELIRVVRATDGKICVDKTGKINGRGAYICYNVECLEKAIKGKKLEKEFDYINEVGDYNQRKVLQAFYDNRVAPEHFYTVSGYGHDDLGREVLDKVFADDGEDSSYDLEYRVRNSDGQYGWVWGRGSISFDDDGKPVMKLVDVAYKCNVDIQETVLAGFEVPGMVRPEEKAKK